MSTSFAVDPPERRTSISGLAFGMTDAQGSPQDQGMTRPSKEEGNIDPEEALESHEVIELQTFSERKAWIEEKIKVTPLIFSSSILECSTSPLVSGEATSHRGLHWA